MTIKHTSFINHIRKGSSNSWPTQEPGCHKRPFKLGELYTTNPLKFPFQLASKNPVSNSEQARLSRKYGRYCINNSRSSIIVDQNIQYFSAYQFNNNLELRVDAMLIKPIQRLTRFKVVDRIRGVEGTSWNEEVDPK